MLWRIKIFALRLLDFILGWPERIWRLLLWTCWINSPRGKHALVRWLIGLVLLVVDLTPMGLVYETVTDAIKYKTRRLNKDEITAAESVFGKTLPIHLITLDPTSWPVKKKKTMAYVSFHTINCDQHIQTHLMIHELMHIWQYSRYGSIYISEAIWAQKWGGGYNYGGSEALLKQVDGKGLSAFNFEQQADIIEEYYRWKNGMVLQWAHDTQGLGDVLLKYQSEVASIG